MYDKTTDKPWLDRAVRFVSDLHHGMVPLNEALHRPCLEALIPDLQQRSCRTTNSRERFLFSALEMRAKGLRDRLRRAPKHLLCT